jgi:hypothetical protein
MRLLPPPVGATSSRRPFPSSVSMASRCPGRNASYPSRRRPASRSVAAATGRSYRSGRTREDRMSLASSRRLVRSIESPDVRADLGRPDGLCRWTPSTSRRPGEGCTSSRPDTTGAGAQDGDEPSQGRPNRGRHGERHAEDAREGDRALEGRLGLSTAGRAGHAERPQVVERVGTRGSAIAVSAAGRSCGPGGSDAAPWATPLAAVAAVAGDPSPSAQPGPPRGFAPVRTAGRPSGWQNRRMRSALLSSLPSLPARSLPPGAIRRRGELT